MAQTTPQSELDAFTAAYLRGGPAATVSTVVAALIARKMVVVLRDRRVAATVETVPEGLSELEQSVLRSLGGPVTLGTLRSSPEVKHLLSSLDRKLVGEALIPPRSRRVAWRAVTSGVAGACVIGLFAVSERLNAGEPVSGLAAAVSLAVLAMVFAVVLARRRLRRDPAGERAFNELRQRYAHLKPTAEATRPSGDPERVAWAVALFGGEVVPPVGADPAGRPNQGASTDASAAGGG
jgi:uncharacterized protein (TIGR04222 family)